MTRLRPNPPWADSMLHAHWGNLESIVGSLNLPAPLDTRFEDLGSGVCGSVLPTRTPGVVLKLTTDAAEARFAGWAASVDPRVWPDGIVRYKGALELGPGVHPQRPGATVWALWREEALSVGELIPDVDPRRLPPASKALLEALATWAQIASYVRHDVARSNVADLATLRVRARQLLDHPLNALLGSSLGRPIGEALGWLLDHHVLLPDTNAGNVGLVVRGYGFCSALTDSSYATFLRPAPPMPARVPQQARGA